jgi:putative acetyltransferase
MMSHAAPTIRLAHPADRERMLELWERAARATHDFLEEVDIVGLRPAVEDVLRSDALQWWVVEFAEGVAGFLGVVHNSIEALFIDPAHHRRGVGRDLVEHAQALAPTEPLVVDVNEANASAIRFYEAVGFEVVGRSPTDGEGRPFPLLHMRRPAPSDHHAFGSRSIGNDM